MLYDPIHMSSTLKKPRRRTHTQRGSHVLQHSKFICLELKAPADNLCSHKKVVDRKVGDSDSQIIGKLFTHVHRKPDELGQRRRNITGESEPNDNGHVFVVKPKRAKQRGASQRKPVQEK